MKYCFTILIFLLNLTAFYGQNKVTPVLEREITVRITEEPLPVALLTISDLGDFVFSYSADAIDVNRKVSINASQKSVRHIVNEIFMGTVLCKDRGKYVILQPVGSAEKSRTIEGYVFDSGSGKKLTETSIYNKDLLISAVTDQYGYFRLELPSGMPVSALHIAKEGYTDTLLRPYQGRSDLVNIELSLKSKDDIPPEIQADKKSSSLWLIPKKIRINTANLKDTIFRKVQFSLLPLISTNRLLTGNAVNDVSVNVIAGYVQGVRTLEVGGVLNIVRLDAGVCQLAGVGNIVGGNFRGVQAAGVFNMEKDMKGVQIGGVYNITKDFSGLQMSGVLNQSRNVNGLQVAGVINNAKDISGVQISGFLNRASYFKGLQLSMVNIADSCKGIPIGLFSYVKKGYHKLEIAGDELFYTNLSLRTGVKVFHTILLAGLRPDNFGSPLWTYGYGAGTTIGRSGKSLFDIDLIYQVVIKGNDFSGNQLFKLYAGFDRAITAKTSIACGLTYNFFVSDTKRNSYSTYYSGLAPYYFSNSTSGNGFNLKTWPGIKLALRFL